MLACYEEVSSPPEKSKRLKSRIFLGERIRISQLKLEADPCRFETETIALVDSIKSFFKIKNVFISKDFFF